MTLQSIIALRETSDSILPPNPLNAAAFQWVKTDRFNYPNEEYKDFWYFYPTKSCKKYPFFEGLENVTSVHHCGPRDFGFEIAPIPLNVAAFQ